MKKTILSLMALPLLLACSSDEQPAASQAGRVPLQVEIGGITRGAIDALPANSNYGVYVTTGSSASSSTVDDGINRRVTYADGKSTMDKTVYLNEGGYAYVWAYYPYIAGMDKGALTAFPLETKSQTDYLVSNAHYANESQPRVSLTMQHALARIHVTLRKADDNAKEYYYKEMTLTDAYLSATYNFDGKYTIEAAMGDITAYTSNGNSSLQDGGVVEFDFLVLPTSSKAMSVYMPNGTIELKTALPTRPYQAGQQYNITITINSQGELVVGDWTIVPWDSSVQNGLNIWRDNKAGDETTDPTVPAEGEHESHAYVDLGLPSGTLWATCNVGANSPEDFGNYYAWGETVVKEVYDWSTYKWCEGKISSLTKYNVKSDFGKVDNLTTLDAADDVANVLWGSKWCLPTEADGLELVNNCDSKWTTLNGVVGYMMISRANGKSIFLPAVGTKKTWKYGNPSDEYDGLYWTSSLNNGYPNDSQTINFKKNDKVLCNHASFRCDGQPVRPVIHVVKVINNVVYN